MKEILITSSVLILALLALRLVFAKKVRRRLIYAAWALVALRLLIPVQIGQLDFSVLTVARPLTETVTEIEGLRVIGQNEREAETQVILDYIQRDQTVFNPETQILIQEALERKESKEEIATHISKTQSPENTFAPQVQEQVRQQVAEQTNFISIGQVATVVWLAGIAVMAIWFATVNLRHSRMLRQNREKLDCDNPIPVFVSEKVGSPCLVGLLRPVVYLTPQSTADETVRRHVLTHELTHYRHGDHIWSWVRCVCLCVYWFDPLVWAAAWFSRRDCELACDEGALARLGEDERIAYGKSLLDVVSQAAMPAHLIQTATAMNETKEQLKQRVNFIVKKPKWSVIAAICMVLVCAIVAGCVAAGPSAGTTSYSVTVRREYSQLDSVEEETITLVYDAKGQLLECRDGEYQYVYTYDKQGNQIACQKFTLQGQLQSGYKYTYNDDGQLILSEGLDYSADPNGVLNEKTEYRYDPDGTLSSSSFYQDGTNLTKECRFDKNGNLLEELDYSGGSTVSRNAYTYTEDGRILTSCQEQYGEPHIQETYFYEAGRLVRKEYVHTCGPLEPDKTVTLYFYDERSRCVESKVEKQDGGYTQTVYTYDAAGNMLSYAQMGSDGPTGGYAWTYDEKGRLLSCQSLSTGSEVLITWTYDARGNVTECVSPGEHRTFTYTDPGIQMPEQVRREFEKRLADDTVVAKFSPQALAPVMRIMNMVSGEQTGEEGTTTAPTESALPENATKWVYLKETVHEEILGAHPDQTTVYSYDESGYPTGYEGYLAEQLNTRYTVQCIPEELTLKVLDGNGYLRYEYTFDEAGRLLTLTYYGSDLRKWKYTYEGGNLVRETQLNYRKENSFSYELYDIKDIYYTYDAQGRQTAQYTYEYYADTPQEMIESHYLRGYVLYSYGADDRPIRAESYSADGTLQNYTEYSYDDANRVKTAKVYQSFGRGDNLSWEVNTIYTTCYDEAGNVIREEVQEDVRFGDGPVTVTTYTYIYKEVPLDYFALEL